MRAFLSPYPAIRYCKDHARRLGLAQGKTLLLDDMDEMYYVYDLAVYTAPPDRSRAIDRYAKSARFEAQSDERLKTTPCKVAWWSLACAIPRKHFDTSGKSRALFHHRAIVRRPWPCLAAGCSARSQADIPDPQLTLHRLATAKPRLARCRAARRRSACPRRYRREHSSRPQERSGISRNRSAQAAATPAKPRASSSRHRDFASTIPIPSSANG